MRGDGRFPSASSHVSGTSNMSGRDHSALYEPLNEYKPLAARVGIVDGPLEYVSLLRTRLPWPFTTRMTVVQLATGDLFLHSPIAFDARLAVHLNSFGRIRHLVFAQ